MIKRLSLLLVLLAAFAAIPAARSQQPTGKDSSAAKQRRPSADSVDLKPSPELQQSLEDLAASVQALAARIASDPQLRASAMRVASGLVSTAQQVVTEQSGAIESALRTAADKIAAAQSVNPRPPANHR
ncbi:MAG TPA: hypothetical protein VE110_13620 [Gemmatimonadaceae bacterium]|jgi:hypothetical protein|nr:hypothetical protein [Gemmatimonadaceae bacterium]